MCREFASHDEGFQHDDHAHGAPSGKGVASRALGRGGGACRKGAARKRATGALLKKPAGTRKQKKGTA